MSTAGEKFDFVESSGTYYSQVRNDRKYRTKRDIERKETSNNEKDAGRNERMKKNERGKEEEKEKYIDEKLARILRWNTLLQCTKLSAKFVGKKLAATGQNLRSIVTLSTPSRSCTLSHQMYISYVALYRDM